MARIGLSGFEIGFPSVGISPAPDGYPANGTASTFSTSVKRTGNSSLRVGTGDTLTTLPLGSRGSASSSWTVFFAFYKEANPVSQTIPLFFGEPGSSQVSFRINTDGSAQVYGTLGGLTAASAALSNSAWHTVEIRCKTTDTISGSVTLIVNGVTAGTGTCTWNTQAATSFSATIQASNIVYYLDDMVADALGTTGTPVAIPNARVALLVATSDFFNNNWTGGVGGTTNLWNAVDNVPPAGTATETDLTQIECASNTGTANYIANLTTWSAAGVANNDSVFSFLAWACHGEDVSTGTKTGVFRLYENGVGGSGSDVAFNFGDDVGALGTYPATWRWVSAAIHEYGTGSGVLGSTMSQTPKLRIGKTDTGTRVASACFMGGYLEYRPASLAPPPARRSPSRALSARF